MQSNQLTNMNKQKITIDQMRHVNLLQSKFYDDIFEAENESGKGGYALNKKANIFTRYWANLRYKQQFAVSKSGVAELVKEFHSKIIDLKINGDFLELGCFSGSPSTSVLINKSKKYCGIDLSEKAINSLRNKIFQKGFSNKAHVESCDFLSYESDMQFDLIYAHGVLHHFENPSPLFLKIRKHLKPDGLLLFAEPSAFNPFYSLIRACYRPFQSDSAWEWPFTSNTVKALELNFKVLDGFGWGMFSLPMSTAIGLPVIGEAALSVYLPTIQAEVKAGWHKNVWHNSYVTAVCSPRESNLI